MDTKEQLQIKIVEIARSLIGTPYKYGAQPQDIPHYLDCSSFTQEAFKRIGIEIPRSTIMQATAGTEVAPETIEPGDLLFFRGDRGHYYDKLFPGRAIYIGHVAMYIGNGQVIEGALVKGGICQAPLDDVIRRGGPIVMAKRLIR